MKPQAHAGTAAPEDVLRHPAVDDARRRLEAVAAVRELDIQTLDQTLHWATCQHGDQLRKSGEPYITHPLEVAVMVADLGGGLRSVQAALLHDVVEDTPATLADVRKRFGDDVARIVDGCTKLSAVHPSASAARRHSDNLRKLFVALADDPRVIVVKLCDRLHNLRTISALTPVKAQRIGEETLAIHAPLAHRLGMGALKAELEDRAFAVADPETYAAMTTRIAQQRDLHAALEEARDELAAHLEERGLSGRVSGRVKHAWSLHRKAQRMLIDPLNVPDLLGLRVICDNVDDCYRILDAVHELWEPHLDRFKDYIAEPKFNSYQSLHTTVDGIAGRTFEVQVRTRSMHETAEHGAAAHHRYKNPGDEPLWIGRLLAATNDDTDDYLHDVEQELKARREIFVLTPQDTVITLPMGASVIDFAYAIHSDIGNRCTGARVDGKMVALETRLQSGQRIEIVTGQRNGPSLDWLEHAVTGRARSRIRRHAVEPVRTEPDRTPAPTPAKPVKRNPQSEAPTQRGRKPGVPGMHGMETRIAGCCKPANPEPIAATLSPQRVTVHSEHCASLRSVASRDPSKVIGAYWTEDDQIVETIDIRIPDRHGTFADIAAATRTSGGTILSSHQEQGRIRLEVAVMPRNRQRLRAAIRLVDGVVNVH